MKINKDGHVFTIVFTFISTVVLVFPLTLAYVGTKPIADAYWLDQHILKTLASMGLPADKNRMEEARAAYASLEKYTIGTPSKDSAGNPIVVYEHIDFDAINKDHSKLELLKIEDKVINKALQDTSYTGNLPVFFYKTEVNGVKYFGGDFTGPGLWGNISLALGVNADASALTGVQVLFNVETPGLGGRIAETWFTDQFKGLKPAADGLSFNRSGQKAENGFDAIAGATISSVAVKDTVNHRALGLLKAFIEQKGGNL